MGTEEDEDDEEEEEEKEKKEKEKEKEKKEKEKQIAKRSTSESCSRGKQLEERRSQSAPREQMERSSLWDQRRWISGSQSSATLFLACEALTRS